MILLWLAIGVVLAIMIARLNESNKLFWATIMAFSIGIAAGSIVNRAVKEDDSVDRSYPTQVTPKTSNPLQILTDDFGGTQCLEPNLVSQDSSCVKLFDRDTLLVDNPFKDVPTDPPETT